MRRTDMVRRMVLCYDTLLSGMNRQFTSEELMDNVLEICEENGMLPPFKESAMQEEIDIDGRSVMHYTYPVYEWEKE